MSETWSPEEIRKVSQRTKREASGFSSRKEGRSMKPGGQKRTQALIRVVRGLNDRINGYEITNNPEMKMLRQSYRTVASSSWPTQVGRRANEPMSIIVRFSHNSSTLPVLRIQHHPLSSLTSGGSSSSPFRWHLSVS